MEAGGSSDAVYTESVENETDLNMDLTPKRSNGGRGGFTCCVPHCYNNSKKHKDIRFYVIPRDLQIRAAWLSKISRNGFDPSKNGHRV